MPSAVFQFTHPGRGATSRTRVGGRGQSFNSRTPGGVRRPGTQGENSHHDVSIHAPREGCDFSKETNLSFALVSIHAPREGCDTQEIKDYQEAIKFQFTHPGRGATPSARLQRIHWRGFNSRTPGGVRPNAQTLSNMREQFQFTHPGRGATGDALHLH